MTIELLSQLLTFVDHKDNCDFLQPMWHKGPCDCGLFKILERIHDQNSVAMNQELAKLAPAFERWLNRGEHER